jgi:hypothetical protein
MSTIKVEISKPVKLPRVSTITWNLADPIDYKEFRRKYGYRPEKGVRPWPRRLKRDK